MIDKIEVVAGVITDGSRVLVGRRKLGKALAGKWEFPGGKIYPNEPFDDALKRELLEELGEDFVINQYLGFIEHHYSHANIVLHAFLIKSELKDYKSIDHDLIKWLYPSEFNSIDLSEADIKLLRLLRNYW